MIESPLIRSYRELLRLEPKAGPDDLKRAYRAMAKVYHPDQNPDPQAAEVFVRIREAYGVLRDPEAVRSLNQAYLEGKGREACAPGMSNLHLGTFFGHRFSRLGRGSIDVEDIDWGEGRERLRIDEQGRLSYHGAGEHTVSILDDPVLDQVEVIFAGQLDVEDTQALIEAFRDRDFGNLPWFVLNNEGMVHFLNRRYEDALACYEALNERIPDNIVFLFRLGLCHEVLAFQHRARGWVAGSLSARRHVKRAVECFERAIRLGAARPYLPQTCMSIRKTLADLLQATGQRWRAHRAWGNIQTVDPHSREAEKKLAETQPGIAGFLQG